MICLCLVGFVYCSVFPLCILNCCTSFKCEKILFNVGDNNLFTGKEVLIVPNEQRYKFKLRYGSVFCLHGFLS